MVEPNGRTKVLDFGLAKLASAGAAGADETSVTINLDQAITEQGMILGSIPYMSPEQAEGALPIRSTNT